TTDAAGHFELDGLAPGTCWLTVVKDRARGHASATSGQGAPVTVTLEADPRVRFRVLDARGAPVTHFEVDSVPCDAADGRFEGFIPRAGSFTLRGAFLSRDVPLPEQAELDLGDVTVDDGITLHGVVLGRDGRPAR